MGKSNGIKYVKGDLFKSSLNSGIIAHVANHMGAMGGFAGALDKRFPLECADYKLHCRENPDFYPRTFFTPISRGNVVFKDSHIAHMICQHQMMGPSVRNIKYNNLVLCMEEVAAHYFDSVLSGGIIAPKFGSFLGGLNWDFVEALIEDIWIDNRIPVTIFHID